MAERHWHWSFRIGNYHSGFEYPTFESAEQVVNHICRMDSRYDATDREIFENPCTCGQPIYIGEK